MSKAEQQKRIRKVMIYALNAAFRAGVIPLKARVNGMTEAECSEITVCGKSTIINWRDTGRDELRVSVWRDYPALNANWPVETVIAMGRAPWGTEIGPELIRRVMAETGCTPRSLAANSSAFSSRAAWRRCGITTAHRAGCFLMTPLQRWIFTTSSIC